MGSNPVLELDLFHSFSRLVGITAMTEDMLQRQFSSCNMPLSGLHVPATYPLVSTDLKIFLRSSNISSLIFTWKPTCLWITGGGPLDRLFWSLFDGFLSRITSLFATDGCKITQATLMHNRTKHDQVRDYRSIHNLLAVMMVTLPRSVLGSVELKKHSERERDLNFNLQWMCWLQFLHENIHVYDPKKCPIFKGMSPGHCGYWRDTKGSANPESVGTFQRLRLREKFCIWIKSWRLVLTCSFRLVLSASTLSWSKVVDVEDKELMEATEIVSWNRKQH